MTGIEYEVVNEFIVKSTKGVELLKPGQIIKLSLGSAKRLLDAGRIKPIQTKLNPEDFKEEIFRQEVSVRNKEYTPGVVGYIWKNHPDQWIGSHQAENRINRLWHEDRLESFKTSAQEWSEIKQELIKLFRQGGN